MVRPPLPPDAHTHTQWSWDADAGSMEGSCLRALELGLPAIAFTEHVDGARWAVPAGTREQIRRRGHLVEETGRFVPSPFDVDGYLSCIERCRSRFPGLRILSGAELGEPHRFPDQSAALLATGAFERMLGSLHSVVVDDQPWSVDDLLGPEAPEGLRAHEVTRLYLAEALELIHGCTDFGVLAHIDFPARHWPGGRGGFPVHDFEEEFRTVLGALAASGRALEVNTQVPLDVEVVRWWWQVGGEAVSFGSDAHEPTRVGGGLAEAAAMVEAQGFRPGDHPHELWLR